MDLTYISEGNEKTGNCYSFDLPARLTCPGMTATCGDKCYAAKLMQIYKGVDAKYTRNLLFANSPEFTDYMVRNIPRGCEFRIHVSGDFKDSAYVEQWAAIIARRPDVTFYTYTRSWRIAAVWSAIRKLAELANVNVNLSCDIETGMPNVEGAETFRWAYLVNGSSYKNEESDAPSWLRRQDIVFRMVHSGKNGNHQWWRKDAVAKGLDPNSVAPIKNRFGAATVCPFERGRELDNFSCSQCRICIHKPKVMANA